MKTKYSIKEARLIRNRYHDLLKGKCVCFHLIEAKTQGRVTESEYRDIRSLKIRCPLSTSGQCDRCRTSQGKIDMFQAVRDLGIIPLFQQMELFHENHG